MLLFLITVTLAGYTSAQIGLCPQPTGDFPNPSSEQCTTFFRCAQGRPNLLRCPANQRFDFLFRTCRPQAQVDCNNQLQIFAAPNGGSVGAGAGSGLLGVGAGAALGGLGTALGGGGIGAGLPQAGLINFLLNRQGGGNQNNNNNNQLALIATIGQMLNKRRAAASLARPVFQPQPQQQSQSLGFNNQQQQVVPQFSPGGFLVPPPPQSYPVPAAPIPAVDPRAVPIVRPLTAGTNAFVDPRGGFGALPPLAPITGQQIPVPGFAGLPGPPANDVSVGSYPGLISPQFNRVQLQNLLDLATTVQQTQEIINDDDNDDNNNDDGSR